MPTDSAVFRAASGRPLGPLAMPCGSIWRCSTMPFGAATPVVPKFISHADPASRWTGANGGLAFFAYCTNYLIDLKCAIIVDVEATTAVRQAEVTAQRRMIDRTQDRFDLWPERLAGDTGYGSAENLAWLVEERGIEPHIPVFD